MVIKELCRHFRPSVRFVLGKFGLAIPALVQPVIDVSWSSGLCDDSEASRPFVDTLVVPSAQIAEDTFNSWGVGYGRDEEEADSEEKS